MNPVSSTNPKHSRIQATVEKISSVPVKTSTAVELCTQSTDLFLGPSAVSNVPFAGLAIWRSSVDVERAVGNSPWLLAVDVCCALGAFSLSRFPFRCHSSFKCVCDKPVLLFGSNSVPLLQAEGLSRAFRITASLSF